ncbi:MAG: hypothetical protein JMN25_17360 [gamma proteobacterium endosymbiont of Lamellibrachia anaximandri]|nr:hypothetical protein [gamma proteobacterium endosymbiont of Lamellibrachia anaximandri]
MELETTVLEERLGAQRTLMAMLIAHLQDGGLINRSVLEGDYWKVQERALSPDHAHHDMIVLFSQVDLMLEGWDRQRRENEEHPDQS